MKPDQARQEYCWRRILASQVPILVVYFALAFYRIGHQSLWVDEVRSIEVATPSGSLFTGGILFRGQGPLYFILLHLWSKLGTSETFLRSLSAILGGIAVYLAYALGLRLFNRQLARVGGTFFATSPFLIWYSQEVRYVILIIMTALLAMLIFAHALFAKRLGWWFLYFGSLVLAIAASPLNVFLPIAQGLYLACSPSQRSILRKWIVCQLAVFALFVWWTNGGQVHRLGGYWQRLLVEITNSHEKLASLDSEERLTTGTPREFNVMVLPYTAFAFSTGFSLGPSIRELHKALTSNRLVDGASRPLTALWPHTLILSISGLLFGGLFLLGVAILWRQPDTGKFLALWLVIPIVGIVGISAFIPSMPYNVRYVAMALPAYYFILASGIAAFRRPMLQMTLLAAVLCVNGLSLANYYFDPQYSREDSRGAAQFLEGTVRPRDAILAIGAPWPLEYYYKGQLPIVSWDKMTIDNRSVLLDDVRKLSQDHDQLWLVAIRPWIADPEGNVKAAIDARYRFLGHQEFPGVDIYSYQLR